MAEYNFGKANFSMQAIGDREGKYDDIIVNKNGRLILETSSEIAQEVDNIVNYEIKYSEINHSEDFIKFYNSGEIPIGKDLEILYKIQTEYGFHYNQLMYAESFGYYPVSQLMKGFMDYDYSYIDIETFKLKKSFPEFIKGLFCYKLYAYIRVAGHSIIRTLMNWNCKSEFKLAVKFILEETEHLKYFLFNKRNLDEMVRIFKIQNLKRKPNYIEHASKGFVMDSSNNSQNSDNIVLPAICDGIEWIESCSKNKDQLKLPMFRKAFLNSIQTQHDAILKMQTNNIGKYYEQIVTNFKSDEDKDNKFDRIHIIFGKEPIIAHIFIFFLKIAGNIDKDIAATMDNESTFIVLDKYSPEYLADIMMRKIYWKFSIFDIIGYKVEELETIFTEIVSKDKEYAKKFWDIFPEVPAAVKNNARSWSSFISEYCSQDGKGQAETSNQKLEIFKSITQSVESLRKNNIEITFDPKFPFYDKNETVKFFSTAKVVKSLPMPNVENAKINAKNKQDEKSVKPTGTDTPIKYWLRNTKTRNLSDTLKIQSVDIDSYAEAIINLRGSEVKDFEHLLDDESKKFIIDELKKTNIKPLHAILIVNALKDEITRKDEITKSKQPCDE